MALDQNWRKSKHEKERLRGRKKQMEGALRQEQQQILLRPLVWQRRQIPFQQVTIGPAPIEGVERKNAVVVRGSEQGMGASPRRDSYMMEVDRERNCYAYGGFGHIAHHYRNQERKRVVDGRRLEYRGRRIKGNHVYENNLKEEENLEPLD